NLHGWVHAAGDFGLEWGGDGFKLGGFSMDDVRLRLTNQGLSLSAHADLPLVGGVTFAGSVLASGEFAVSAVHDPAKIRAGLVRLSTRGLALSTPSATVTAHADVSTFGTADFRGELFANGSYALTGTASLTVGGFTLNAGEIKLGNKGLGLKVSVPIP